MRLRSSEAAGGGKGRSIAEQARYMMRMRWNASISSTRPSPERSAALESGTCECFVSSGSLKETSTGWIALRSGSGPRLDQRRCKDVETSEVAAEEERREQRRSA
jgi:hypothetical protein